jgi:selenophosphate synthase
MVAMTTLRWQMINAAHEHAKAHVEKHKMNVEIYLTNPVGVGEHSDVMDAIEKELEEMAKYEDHMEILNKYFPE